MKIIRATIASFIVLTLLTGIVYPLLITVVARIAFPNQAEGSLISQEGKPTYDEKNAIGSALIGQSFDQPQYFWPRPSATSPQPYNAAASSGSNLGPTNPALQDAVKARIVTLHDVDPGNQRPIPVDLVTTSASGVDPDISIAAAEYQISRIARVRGISENDVRRYVEQCRVEPQFGALGEARINVLKLNLALDADALFKPPLSPATAASTEKR
jgi:K+-transporting ATPase ATPase C chain